MKLIIALFFLTFALNSQSQNSIEFYNNTDKSIYASIAFYDGSNKCWSSKGWYLVEPYSTKIVDLGSYTGDIYYHGFSINPATFWVSETHNNWGSGYSFCIDPDDQFLIRYADKTDCDNRKSFSKSTISRGVNKWTFR